MAIDVRTLAPKAAEAAAPAPAPRGADPKRRRPEAPGEPWYRSLAKLELTGKNKRITDEELVLLTQQLALLLESGNGLIPSLRAFAVQARNPLLASVLGDIALRIEEGRGLSEALELHPRHFDTFFVSVIQAGEASGELLESLGQLAEAYQTRQELRHRVSEAMTYPAILGVVMAGVLVFVFTYMLPRFAELFGDMRHELPITTRFLLGTSEVLKSSWYWLIPISILIVVGAVRLWLGERFRPVRDRLKLGVPYLGRLFSEAYLYQLFTSLGMLLGSRVPHLNAIAIARHTVANARYTRFFDRLAECVEQGAGVAQAFNEASFLPETVRLMVSTGEQAGNLHTVMVRLGKKYQEDLERDIRKLSSLLEPVMLVVMGVMVGTIASSLIIPIFKLSKTVQ